MKKVVFIFSLVTIVIQTGLSQAAQSIYFELFGPGVVSFNYDTRFSSGEAGLGGRIGIGGYSIDGSGIIFLPLGLNMLFGKDQKHYFEVGGGVTPVFESGDGDSSDGNFTETFGHLIMGYRMQPLNGGYTFRAFICPVFGNGFFIPYYFGLSFGYKF